jgi:hypothetical protein
MDIGGSGLLDMYNRSMSNMLSAVFPEHKWELHKFSRLAVKQWDDILRGLAHFFTFSLFQTNADSSNI